MVYWFSITFLFSIIRSGVRRGRLVWWHMNSRKNPFKYSLISKFLEKWFLYQFFFPSAVKYSYFTSVYTCTVKEVSRKISIADDPLGHRIISKNGGAQLLAKAILNTKFKLSTEISVLRIYKYIVCIAWLKNGFFLVIIRWPKRHFTWRVL